MLLRGAQARRIRASGRPRGGVDIDSLGYVGGRFSCLPQQRDVILDLTEDPPRLRPIGKVQETISTVNG